MIIGLEWIILALMGLSLVLTVGVVIATVNDKSKLCSVFVVLTLALEASGVVLYGFTATAQDQVETQYMNYLELQVKVEKYDKLSLVEQYEVSNDVMTYNLWYERNKSDLDNPWTLKGTSDYAKKFNYILIGG